MLLAFEGIDGSGKGTQAGRLAETATRAGYRVASFSFPRYDDNPFSVAVAAYLNGELGGLDEVHPQLSALLYACDRFHARPELVAALAENDLVVCDRYVAVEHGAPGREARRRGARAAARMARRGRVRRVRAAASRPRRPPRRAGRARPRARGPQGRPRVHDARGGHPRVRHRTRRRVARDLPRARAPRRLARRACVDSGGCAARRGRDRGRDLARARASTQARA